MISFVKEIIVTYDGEFCDACRTCTPGVYLCIPEENGIRWLHWGCISRMRLVSLIVTIKNVKEELRGWDHLNKEDQNKIKSDLLITENVEKEDETALHATRKRLFSPEYDQMISKKQRK